MLSSTTNSIPSPSASSTASLFIGNDAAGSAYCFNGRIDDVALYNRILSSCERYELINQESLSVTPPSNQNYLPGDTVMFTVATTDSCLTYQWQGSCGSGFLNINNAGMYQGATNDTLFLNGVSAGMNTCMYRCIITSCYLCQDTTVAASLHSTVGISEIQNGQQLAVNPSPAHDVINVHLSSSQYDGIRIYNVLGNLVLASAIDKTNEITLNVSDLPKGVYLLEAHAANQPSGWVRFVKQ